MDVAVEVSESDLLSSRFRDSKKNPSPFCDSSAARATNDDDDDDDEKKTLSRLLRPGVVGMQWLSSPGSVANYPLPNFIRRGSGRASRETRFQNEKRFLSLGRRGRGHHHPASAFQRPSFAMASIKIATRNEFFSGQSVTCVEVGESEKISGKAARPSAVRARDVSSRARSPADRLARPDKKKRKGASECADVARRDRAGDRVPTRAERSPAFRRCGIA